MVKVPSDIDQIVNQLSELVKRKYPDLKVEVKISLKDAKPNPKTKTTTKKTRRSSKKS